MATLLVLITVTLVAMGSNTRSNFIECDACHLVMNRIHDWYFDQTLLLDALKDIIDVYCWNNLYTSHEVCIGTINEMAPSVMGSLGNKWLDADLVCSKVGMCDSP